MKKNGMKRTVSLILACLMILALACCGAEQGADKPAEEKETPPAGSETASVTEEKGSERHEEGSEEASGPSETEEENRESGEDPASESAKILVAVFSATGTTKGVAERIAAMEGADLYEIVPEEPYTKEDLNWHDSKSRTTKEQDDKNSRPGIAGDKLDLSGYEKIYVGYPIWWGEEPRILDTFVESYDFTGITMIPFCTSSSSGLGRSGKNLEERAGSGNWLEGKRFPGSVSDDDLQSWIESLE